MSRKKIREIADDAGYCQMATCVDGQPRVRPMKFVITEDFRFWCTTFDISGKVKELKNNARVELIADLTGGLEKKRKLLELHPGARRLFSGPEDPNLVHVEVVPTKVRWKKHSFGEYNMVE